MTAECPHFPNYRVSHFWGALQSVTSFCHLYFIAANPAVAPRSPPSYFCDPWSIVGLPPVWYKSAPYRSRSVIDPRGVAEHDASYR
jgi:hypothetical protein